MLYSLLNPTKPWDVIFLFSRYSVLTGIVQDKNNQIAILAVFFFMNRKKH